MFLNISMFQFLGYNMSMTSTKSVMFQALIFLGIVFLIIGAMMVLQNRKEGHFYPVEGVMKTSQVEKISRTRPGSKTSSVGWELIVTYEYEVDGDIYENDEIASERPGSEAIFNTPPSKELLALAEKFKAGKTVTVYVAPNRPHVSILLKSKNYGLGLLAISGLLFALAFYLARR